MTVQHSSLSVSSARGNDADHGVLLSQKVFTRKDFVPTLFIGKEGKNIKRLKELCGREFKITMKDRHILVSGTDAEGVKRSVEKVTQEVQRIEMLPKVKVLTDEDAGVHRMIFGRVFGKKGKNIERLKSETDIDFHIINEEVGCIVVRAVRDDFEDVKIAEEMIKQEVQRAKNQVVPQFTENVLTDEDADVHNQICRRIIGDAGENMKQLMSELGPNIKIDLHKFGRIVVSGTDAEMLIRAVGKLKQKVLTARNIFVNPFTGKVLTDEDADVHSQICRRIIGKGGQSIKYLLSKLGPNINVTFKAGQIFVSGSDAEEVQRAVEILKHEVQNVKDGVVPLPFTGKVLTHKDADFHRKICGRIIGKRGENIEQLTAELGSYIEMESKTIGHIVVGGIDAKVVETAVEILKHEVLRAKSEVFPQFAEKVLTSEEADVHSQICRMIIGKGGENMKQLTKELGPYVNVDLRQLGHIDVSGNDAGEVERAIEKLKQEVKRAINIIVYPFKGKVLTDESANFHFEICGKIFGREGENINQMTLELGSNIRVNTSTAGHMVVAGTNAGVVERAVEILKQEVQNIKNKAVIPSFTEKVLTHKDVEKHKKICGKIIGKGGQNIKYLLPKLGPNIRLDTITDGHIVVSGTDAEEIEKAVEILKQEVQNIEDEDDALPFRGKVSTDEDTDVHNKLCGKIFGKEGENINQLTSELGSSIRVHSPTAGHIVVAGRNAGEVERAVEILKQEVQNIKDEDDALPFTGKVLTDEDADFHRDICRRIIGKGGENIKQLTAELGPSIRLQIQKFGHILVSGTDAEKVERAVEILKQEVQRGYNKLGPFTEEVFTIEDAEKHSRICRIIIGKGGHKIKNLKAELGSDIDLTPIKNGYIVVSGTNAEMVGKAAEKIKLEVQRVKKMVVESFTEKVTTNEDGDIHAKICGRLIGKGGCNLQLMKLNSGLNFHIDVPDISKTPYVYVYASSMQVLEKAVEVVKHRIETVRKEIILDSCKSLYEDWHMKTENS
ncbi:vigilin-like [Mizuhopecten yessoensis]|uniref:vigilin-like n=1 Tax=Mizuhopecten yessoensis TaxID=6573 RepID=UPI000B45F7FC|nr:vigilin-like [Mizuhopecten yessoensis]